MERINEILKLFGLGGKDIRIERINSGHINMTFKVTAEDKVYILQCLNGSLLGCPEKIMENIARMTECVENTIHFLTHDGKNYLRCDNAVWRIYEFVPNSVSYDTLEDERLIYGFGSILGRFHRDTAHIAVDELYVTIEDFHNTKKRIGKLSAFEEYKRIFDRFIGYTDRLSKKGLPIKAVHNDVKCSNAVFDRDTGEALALIDLDTVMPGYYVYDIGDGIRSACIRGDRIDSSRLRAFCRGYFSEMSGVPSSEEIFLGLICVTAELSARYLYDALSGGYYFADKTQSQKIQRGEQLLRLAENIADNEAEIIRIIRECV